MQEWEVGAEVKQEDIELLKQLEEKDNLTEKEFEKYEYLKKKRENDERMTQFRKNQQEPYESKRSRAVNLAWEFYKNIDIHGNCYVAVGGLDSITLFLFLRSIGIDVPAVSVSSLEDKSIQKVHKALGVKQLRPLKSKVEVIREFGWPVISKEIAGKIDTLNHPTEDNVTVRHAIITGETGAQGGWRTESRMQLPKKWLKLFGGSDSEGAALGYQKAPIQVSDLCCYWLKELPCDLYHRNTGRWPYMGLMASEKGRREKALAVNGCNYISKNTRRSCPFATFWRHDLLQLTLEMEEWYQKHWEEFRPISRENEDGTIEYGEPVHLESIVPTIYGGIYTDDKGILQTRDAQRTGCSMCGFGVHKEERPNRFDLLWERNPKEWEFWMNRVVQDEYGEWYGWGKVLDYIGVGWKKPWIHIEAKRQSEKYIQTSLFEPDVAWERDLQ